MTKIRFVYKNLWRNGTIYNKTDQHPQYPWEDTQLDTPSQFARTRYGSGSGNGVFIIDSTNDKIDFDEGGAELTATLTHGTYNGLAYAAAIAAAMNAAPGKALTYACAYNETTAKFTISAGSNFTIRWNTGTHKTTDISDTAGYLDTANDTGDKTYTSDNRRIHFPAAYADNDFGALNDVNFIAIINHTISSAAVISLILSTTSDFSTGNTTISVTYNAGSIFQFFTTANKRYARLQIQDPTNPNAYVQIGPISVGKYFEPSRTFVGGGYEDGKDDNSDVDFSTAGVLYAQERPIITARNFAFERMDDSSKAEVLALLAECGITKGFIVCFDSDYPNANSYLVHLESIVLPAYSGRNTWNWNCSLKEMV